MSALWTLFDYGVGNLHSLRKSLERAGARTEVTTDPLRLADSTVAVLPGVGAFGHVMESLAPAAEALRARHRVGDPILGVCIGQQVLHPSSLEDPEVPGIGLFSGMVKRLPADAGKVPHMGWNTLRADPDDPILGPADGQHVYYVHSYAAAPGPCTFATTDYGMTFSAAERERNTVAFQFHPEKSSTVGQAILARTVQDLEGAL